MDRVGLVTRVGVALAAVAVVSSSPAGPQEGQTFGHGGWTVTAIGRDASAAAVEVKADGSIVAAGSTGDDFALARYLPDGELDQSFSNDGTARLDFGRADAATAITVQHGVTVVGGAACTVHEGIATADRDGPCAFALARYTADGKLDRRFGNAGKTLTPLGATRFAITTLVARPSGAIIAAGGGAAFATVIKNGRIVVPPHSSPRPFQVGGALARYTAAGRLDPTFGDHGIVVTPFFILKNGLRSSETDGFSSQASRPRGGRLLRSTTCYLPATPPTVVRTRPGAWEASRTWSSIGEAVRAQRPPHSSAMVESWFWAIRREASPSPATQGMGGRIERSGGTAPLQLC